MHGPECTVHQKTNAVACENATLDGEGREESLGRMSTHTHSIHERMATSAYVATVGDIEKRRCNEANNIPAHHMPTKTVQAL